MVKYLLYIVAIQKIPNLQIWDVVHTLVMYSALGITILCLGFDNFRFPNTTRGHMCVAIYNFMIYA
jgi:hypothetical protein